jgi:hypothetical protein
MLPNRLLSFLLWRMLPLLLLSPYTSSSSKLTKNEESKPEEPVLQLGLRNENLPCERFDQDLDDCPDAECILLTQCSINETNMLTIASRTEDCNFRRKRNLSPRLALVLIIRKLLRLTQQKASCAESRRESNERRAH